jgi:glycosyltransferase involved in cell wall biosynthesis
MIKLSIVIPVYNDEKEVGKAIASCLAQTERNMELILVDDGSKDNSLSICREYEKMDQRVTVIHQENAGVSVARNAGLCIATGEYIGFVDADDWIEPNMYERLLAKAAQTGAEVVMCDATTVYKNGKAKADTITQLQENRSLKKSDFTPSLLVEMAGSACRCIYRGELLKNNEIRFPVGVKFSEDRIFNLYAFGHARKVYYLKESYYNRFVNRKSTVNRFHEDYFDTYKKAADQIEKAISAVWNNDESYQKAYLGQFIGTAFDAIANYYYKTSTLTGKERREAVKRVCEDEQLRDAIVKSGYGRAQKNRWILQKNLTALIIYGKLKNLKHGR